MAIGRRIARARTESTAVGIPRSDLTAPGREASSKRELACAT